MGWATTPIFKRVFMDTLLILFTWVMCYKTWCLLGTLLSPAHSAFVTRVYSYFYATSFSYLRFMLCLHTLVAFTACSYFSGNTFLASVLVVYGCCYGAALTTGIRRVEQAV